MSLKLPKEQQYAIFAAIFVIFVALLNTMLSAGIAIGALSTVLIYEFYIREDKNDSKK